VLAKTNLRRFHGERDEKFRLLLRGTSEIQRPKSSRVQRQAEGGRGKIDAALRTELTTPFFWQTVFWTPLRRALRGVPRLAAMHIMRGRPGLRMEEERE